MDSLYGSFDGYDDLMLRPSCVQMGNILEKSS